MIFQRFSCRSEVEMYWDKLSQYSCVQIPVKDEVKDEVNDACNEF